MCYKASQQHAPHLVRVWENYGQTKIAVQSNGGEEELAILQAQAMSLGVVAKIVHDAGRTQIAAGSATVLGIGPGKFFLTSLEIR
jgi:PTH2 family peptidyl-tRNA hydrolase